MSGAIDALRLALPAIVGWLKRQRLSSKELRGFDV